MKLIEEDQSLIILVSAAVFMFTVGVISVVAVLFELAHQRELTPNRYIQCYDNKALQVWWKTQCDKFAE